VKVIEVAKKNGIRASPRVPKTVSQSRIFGKIEKTPSPTTTNPTSQSFGTWKKYAHLRLRGSARGSRAFFSFVPSRAHGPRLHLPNVIHGRLAPPVAGAPARGSGGAEPVPDDLVVMQHGPKPRPCLRLTRVHDVGSGHLGRQSPELYYKLSIIHTILYCCLHQNLERRMRELEVFNFASSRSRLGVNR
jgi:hypothetical protein